MMGLILKNVEHGVFIGVSIYGIKAISIMMSWLILMQVVNRAINYIAFRNSTSASLNGLSEIAFDKPNKVISFQSTRNVLSLAYLWRKRKLDSMGIDEEQTDLVAVPDMMYTMKKQVCEQHLSVLDKSRYQSWEEI